MERRKFYVSDINIIIPTKDRPLSLMRCLKSLDASGFCGSVLVLIQQDGKVQQIKDVCQQSNFRNIKIESVVHYKVGLSAIWNFGLLSRIMVDPKGLYLLLNDDCVFSKADWAAKAVELFNSKDILIASLCGDQVVWYSAFIFPVELLLRVGWFDEAYVSGGWEDDDFAIRIAGLCREGEKTSLSQSSNPQSVMEYISIIDHRGGFEGSQWDHNINKIHFQAKWQSVPKNHPLAKRRKYYDQYYALKTEIAKRGG